MPVVGIVICEILEFEFARLLSEDPDVAGITVLEDAVSLGFIDALKSNGGVLPRTVSRLEGFRPASEGRLEVVARVLELGLHHSKRLLQAGLSGAVGEMAPYVAAIVLGYGLCGNALQDPEELFAGAGVPILIPMDEDHPVDDCVGLIIGGREQYYGEQCKEAGTFFMIPGWTKHWGYIFEKECGKLDPQMAKCIFSAYKRSLLIPIPHSPVEEMMRNTEEFNQFLGLRTEVRNGTLDLLYSIWKGAKKAASQSLE